MHPTVAISSTPPMSIANESPAIRAVNLKPSSAPGLSHKIAANSSLPPRSPSFQPAPAFALKTYSRSFNNNFVHNQIKLQRTPQRNSKAVVDNTDCHGYIQESPIQTIKRMSHKHLTIKQLVHKRGRNSDICIEMDNPSCLITLLCSRLLIRRNPSHHHQDKSRERRPHPRHRVQHRPHLNSQHHSILPSR